MGGTGLTPEWAKLEVAVAWYRDRKTSMARAARIAGVSRPVFQRELGKRGVKVDLKLEDLRADLEALRSLGLS